MINALTLSFLKLYIFKILFYFPDTIKCTCILETDFGLSLNCNFKKSSLFRVRNLGGIKAHVGLGLFENVFLGKLSLTIW